MRCSESQLETGLHLFRVALWYVELIHLTLTIAALLSSKEEVPFVTVGQDDHRHPFVEGVLEQLAARSLAVSDCLTSITMTGRSYTRKGASTR